MVEKKILLEKLDNIPISTAPLKGFNPTPEYRGNGMYMRFKRLFHYRSIYLGHIWRHVCTHSKSLFTKNVMVQTFWGRRLTLPAQDANTQFLYTSGALGLGENGLIRFLIRELRVDDIFYDIGANYGFYTALAQEILSEGEIHAFEPSSNVFSYLTQLKKEKTFLNEIALSDENGSKEFFDSSASNSSGKSTTSAQVAHGHQWDYTTTTVHAVTLDEYCRTHTAPTIIKIDVEGAEADVLLGGAHLLKEKAPIVAVELWSGGALSQFSLPTLAVFKKFDYTPFFIEDSGNLKITTYEYLENWLKTEHQETNLVFKPHGSTK